MRASTPFVREMTSSPNASFLEFMSNVQRLMCDGERSSSETGSSIVILLLGVARVQKMQRVA